MTGAAEQFHVQVSAEPRPVDVLLNVDIQNGLVMSSKASPSERHTIELQEISKWTLSNGRLLLYTRPQSSSVSKNEDDVVVLLGSAYTMRAVLDTITSCCMQLAEILEHEEEESDRRARRRPAYVHPASSSVRFWHEPDFSGFMYSQGEVIKTWRKRWFVLKDGYLFRFSGPEQVGPEATPRGVLDLSTVSVVSADGQAKDPHGIRVVTGTGKGDVRFLAEDEEGQVRWISALEEGVASVLRKVAGVDAERPVGSCIERLEKGYSRMSRGGHGQQVQQVQQDQVQGLQRVSMVDRFRQPASVVERKELAYGLGGGGGGYGGGGGGGYGGGVAAGGVHAEQQRLPDMIQIANVNYDGGVAGARRVQASAVPQSPVPVTSTGAPDLVNLMDEASAPVVQSPQPAAQRWEALRTDEGAIYYWNRYTNETRWDRPC